MDFKRPNWSHLGRTGWEKERRRRKEEEEEEKKRRSGDQAKQAKGMETTLSMDITLDMISIMNRMDFVWDSRKVYEFQI